MSTILSYASETMVLKFKKKRGIVRETFDRSGFLLINTSQGIQPMAIKSRPDSGYPATSLRDDPTAALSRSVSGDQFTCYESLN